MPTNIALIASDIAPCSAGALLEKYLTDRGHTVVSLFTAGGKHSFSLQQIEETIIAAEVIWIGLSSTEEAAQIELTAARTAHMLDKPYAVFADWFGAWQRTWYADMVFRATYLFVLNEQECRIAQERFPRTTVIVSGNPTWGAYFTPRDRDAARALAKARSDDECIVLAPGSKDLMLNYVTWSGIIEGVAVANRQTKRPAAVVLAPHPGDKNDLALYTLLVERGNMLGIRVMMLRKPDTTSALIPGADVVVNGSSACIEALAQHIPAIDYYPLLAQCWLYEMTGKQYTVFSEAGVTVGIYGQDTSAFAETILNTKSSCARQETLAKLPHISEQESLATMAKEMLLIA